VRADPAAGSVIVGCGTRIAGCTGRVVMTFSLTSSTGGPVLYVRASLHSISSQACLIGATSGFQLPAGESLVQVSFDQSDDCRTPVDVRNMALVVEGPIEVASRQEWGITYTFLP
jgi:hypothetical protein